MVLMDLIGSTTARFVCTFRNTCVLNRRLRQIEETLKSSSSLRRVTNGPPNMFLSSYRTSSLADDHTPFLERSVPILHLIPTNFPTVWHTFADNEQRLNQQSILNLNKVVRVFVVDYLMTCINNTSDSKCQLK